jgi:hypothetical protein
MAGRRPSRESGPEDPSRRDEERRREREARARAREAAEQAEAAQRAANIERLSRSGRSERPSRDVDPTGEPVPAFAAPATRAGRDRAVPFQPLAPAEPAPEAPAAEPTGGSGRAERRARREQRERERVAALELEPAAAPSAAREPKAARQPKAAREPKPPRESLAIPGGALLTTLLASPRALGLGAVALVALVGGIAVAAGGGGDSPAVEKAKAAQSEQAAREAKWAKSPYGVPTKTPLPPDTRVVAFTGAPRAKALGILGVIPLEQAAARLKRQSVPYARKTRPVLRSFDLIATVASANPGPAGKYRTRQPSSVIAKYLRAARRHRETLMLDVQPGQSNFVDELRPLERWLREPDVQLALDPEWRMRPGVVPGTQIGWVSAGEIQATLDRVARIIQTKHLPPKLVVVHRFTPGMIRDLDTVKVPKGIVGVISIDGVGAAANKIDTYNRIAPTLPKPWLAGFKLFYTEDAAAGGVMSGKSVMALKPRPSVVLYE